MIKKFQGVNSLDLCLNICIIILADLSPWNTQPEHRYTKNTHRRLYALPRGNTRVRPIKQVMTGAKWLD